MVSYHTGIVILQFIFFVPAAISSIYLCIAQGWKLAAAAWRFIAVLSLLRVAGAIAYFCSLNNPSADTLVTVVVCDLLGLAPLNLVCVGLLGRVNKIPLVINPIYFTMISLISLAGLIVGIVGASLAVKSSGNSATYSINNEVKAALAIFITNFGLMLIALVGISAHVILRPNKHAALGREILLLPFIAASAPFLLIRLIYAAMADYAQDPRFELGTGNQTIDLCMAVLTEIIVGVCCLTAGFVVSPTPQLVKAHEDDKHAPKAGLWLYSLDGKRVRKEDAGIDEQSIQC